MGPARKKLVLLMIISCVPTPVIAGEEDPTQEKRLSSEESAEPKRDPTRVIYAPTAMGREKGEWGLTKPVFKRRELVC